MFVHDDGGAGDGGGVAARAAPGAACNFQREMLNFIHKFCLLCALIDKTLEKISP